jgi:uncharacterized protein YndB with AHSA1/START domain
MEWSSSIEAEEAPPVDDISRRIEASPEQVFAVLSDGWLYPSWVVGASRIRDVDQTWPQVGSRLHHSFGVWPLVVDDTTEVLECEPDRRLVLQARGWPAGEATVKLQLEADGAGFCRVTMAEDASSGPGTLIPPALRQPPIRFRNTESLKRLAYLAEGRK